MGKIGFDNEKYIKLQSENIKKRIDMFGGKLYLEFGGKLFDDFHASRVLPGFAPDAKVKMLLELKEQAEIVIVINADKVVLTGKKWTDRVYLRYTGHPGGQREITPAQMMQKPNGAERLMKKVVKGMLPKTKLGDRLLGNLYVYDGAEHPHQAQTPKTIDINSLS